MKYLALLLAAVLCLTGCRGNSSDLNSSAPETTRTAAAVSDTAAAADSTAKQSETQTESTTAAAGVPSRIAFQELLAEPGAAKLTGFADSIVAAYVQLITENAQPDGDFTAFGAAKQLSDYLTYAASKEMTGCTADNPYHLGEVQTENRGSWILVKGFLETKNSRNGICTVLIGERDGDAVLLDFIRDAQDSADLLNRPEQVQSPVPDYWSDAAKWQPLMQKLGLN